MIFYTIKEVNTKISQKSRTQKKVSTRGKNIIVQLLGVRPLQKSLPNCAYCRKGTRFSFLSKNTRCANNRCAFMRQKFFEFQTTFFCTLSYRSTLFFDNFQKQNQKLSFKIKISFVQYCLHRGLHCLHVRYCTVVNVCVRRARVCVSVAYTGGRGVRSSNPSPKFLDGLLLGKVIIYMY